MTVILSEYDLDHPAYDYDENQKAAPLPECCICDGLLTGPHPIAVRQITEDENRYICHGCCEAMIEDDFIVDLIQIEAIRKLEKFGFYDVTLVQKTRIDVDESTRAECAERADVSEEAYEAAFQEKKRENRLKLFYK
jgi:hypothetical protein